MVVVVLLVLALGTAIPHSKKIPNKRAPELGSPYQSREWQYKIGNSNFTYRSLVTMLNKKNSLVETIGEHIKNIRQQSSISSAVKLKMNVLLIYQRELKAAENLLTTVLKDLNQTLSSDYHSIENIKRSCKIRQEDMRYAAVLVEEDYNVILNLEKEMASHHPNASLQSHFNLVNEFLAEIAHAADTLESNLVEDVFSDYKNTKGAEIETVVKLSEDSLFEHNLKRLKDHPQDGEGAKDSSRERRRGRGGGVSQWSSTPQVTSISCPGLEM